MSDTFLTASEASKIASTNKVVLREINLIQEKILDAVHNCSSDNNCQSGSYCITVTGDTPMTYFGQISTATVTNGGQDYEPVVATVSFDDTSVAGLGTGATADLTINDDGEITDVTVTNGGADYVDGETDIVITHPEGVDFTATVSVAAGAVDSVTIVTSGSGYGPLLPEITIANAGNGQGAVLTPVVEAGVITDVTVDSGGYLYDTGTTATVTAAPTSAGADATVTLTVTENPLSGVDPYNYYLYLTDQDTACPVEKDIQHIISYFRKKDYSIQAQINPTTNSTIQWKICWC